MTTLESASTTVLLIALFTCLFCSAFFSLSETCMMAVNRYRLRSQAQAGKRGAILAERLLSQTDKLLGVILLGNNLINSASSALAAIITIRLVGNNEWALAISTTAVTFLILIFSEATPKVIVAAHPERYAFRVSYLLTPMLKLFYPVVWFVNLFVTGLLRLLRQRSEHSENPHISPEELRILVLEAGSFIEKKHHSILLNLFELDNITVDDIMVPRAQIEAIDIEADVEDLRKKIATCHHTRLPVYQDNPDNIIGFIHARKVLHMHYHELTAESLRTILREPYYIPSGTPLFTQLHNFQENQRRIGLVVNEYGDIQGLVTLEDILEEFIGEFTTHAPSQQQNWQPQADKSILIEGASLLRDLNRKLGLNLPLNGPRTLNGLIIEYLQTLPEADTCLILYKHRLEILQTQNHAVKMVKLYPSAT